MVLNAGNIQDKERRVSIEVTVKIADIINNHYFAESIVNNQKA